MPKFPMQNPDFPYPKNPRPEVFEEKRVWSIEHAIAWEDEKLRLDKESGLNGHRYY